MEYLDIGGNHSTIAPNKLGKNYFFLPMTTFLSIFVALVTKGEKCSCFLLIRLSYNRRFGDTEKVFKERPTSTTHHNLTRDETRSYT